MAKRTSTSAANGRVSRHRTKVVASGARCVEVTVPSRDADLVKSLAAALREGGEGARRIREMLEPIAPAPKARTGAELVAFFRSSPLAEAALEAERDASSGRAAELE
jgi:hypothetical protein